MSKKQPERPECRFRSFSYTEPESNVEHWVNESYQLGFTTMQYNIVKDRIVIMMIKPVYEKFGR